VRVLHANRLTGLPDNVFSVTTETGLPQRRFIHTYDCMSEDIGFRTVETAEPTVADEWMIDRAHEAQRECQRLVETDPGTKLEGEVWHCGAVQSIGTFCIISF
jgi:hypothetical protein